MIPRVTVILPFYNRETVLSRSIVSVLNQSYADFELILVDDGSTDRSRAMAESFSDDRIRVVGEGVNRGAAIARNKGLSIAQGEYIAFQDSDDEWLTSKLEMQVRRLDQEGNKYGAVFGGKILLGMDDRYRFGEDKICYVPHICDDDTRLLSAILVSGNVISPQTLLFKKELLRKIGLFDERLKNNNDWEFMLRLSQACQIQYMRCPVVVAYISEDSISKNRSWATASLALIAEKHRELLARAPKSYASLLRRIGNGYYLEGDLDNAVAYHRAALLADPTQGKSWARLVVSMVHKSAKSLVGASQK